MRCSSSARPDDALASFDEALALTPDHVGALINRGIALKDLGRLDDAVAAYERALAINPDAANAYVNLGQLRCPEGENARALAAAVQAIALDPSDEAKTLFVEGMQATAGSPSIQARCVRCCFVRLAEPWDRPADLAIPAISLVKLEPAIREGCERAAAAWPGASPAATWRRASPAIAADPPLRTILVSVPVCDIELERLLTALRVLVLAGAVRGQPPVDVWDVWLAFGCALAQQCFINEYVFEVTATERTRSRACADASRRPRNSAARLRRT